MRNRPWRRRALSESAPPMAQTQTVSSGGKPLKPTDE